MIDEKKLFEVIKEYSYPITQFDNSVDIGMTLSGIKQAIDEQPKIGEWIPCSERLPEVEADVLLSLRSLDVYTGYRANTEGMFYVEGEGYVEYENVLAWKPLPDPYEVKSDE